MPFLQKLISPISSYAHWLHLRWPSGIPESLPVVGQDGTTSIQGVRIAGDLLGVPLLKFAADSGARAIQAFLAENAFIIENPKAGLIDLAIVGGGVAGLSAALEAKKAGLNFVVYEASEPFSTIVNFTNKKPIFTYPRAMKPAGDVELSANNKEDLLAELRSQAENAEIPFENRRIDHIQRKGNEVEVYFTEGKEPARAKRVLICTGRSGDYHKLNVPGEDLEKVHNRLFDPKDYAYKKVLVVGGGDSALETAISLKQAQADIQLSYRGAEFTRPKPENIENALSILGDNILFESQIVRIEPDSVVLKNKQSEQTLANEAVFVCLGREAPVDFFKRSGLEVHGLWSGKKIASFAFAFLAILLLYRWKKSNTEVSNWFYEQGWFPFNLNFSSWTSPNILSHLLQHHLASPGFYYELLYSLTILVFGVRRILRYQTPYIRWQTLSLMTVQIFPLFLLPNFILPILGDSGVFNSGAGAWLADQLFPIIPGTEIREYWRSVGFILAWPLFVWNVFTPSPNAMWIAIAFFQTFVLIPWLVYRYGKGAYCGWICSCGALAETLGDAHRSKMPHGPFWNKLNIAGQVILAIVFSLLLLRIASWLLNSSPTGKMIEAIFNDGFTGLSFFGLPLSYEIVVDYFLAGIIGLGLYFHFSGRTWCRFFCPLAALMHIYARFSRFRIFTEKEKCISCNACTSICHQGIDVMNFANKGLPMQDPECVRCSACVYTCPTGTLSFGRLDATGKVMPDKLQASPVLMREGSIT
ncbi:MAG: NAD(P)-binding domain-containing protein [Methylococcaceae bacterium]|jgi:thioredoxin reductase/ferredoxin